MFGEPSILGSDIPEIPENIKNQGFKTQHVGVAVVNLFLENERSHSVLTARCISVFYPINRLRGVVDWLARVLSRIKT